MSLARFFILLICFALTSCLVPVSPTPTPIPVAPTASPTVPPRTFVDVAVFGESGQGALSVSVGNVVTVTLAFRPSQRTANMTTEWKNHVVTQMRYCTGQNCTLPNDWQPFTQRVNVRVPVEWVGLSEYAITAQFHDATGNIIPAGNALSDSASSSMSITGIVDERTPIAARPAAIQTVVTRAQNEFPVVGKIQVGERPMVGGKAGSTLQIKVAFQALSPRGDVKEMRVKFDRMGRCLTPAEMQDAKWESLVAEKIFSYTIAINWQTFRAHVQYRDVAGYLSPVYCGEVVIEGSP